MGHRLPQPTTNLCPRVKSVYYAAMLCTQTRGRGVYKYRELRQRWWRNGKRKECDETGGGWEGREAVAEGMDSTTRMRVDERSGTVAGDL